MRPRAVRGKDGRLKNLIFPLQINLTIFIQNDIFILAGKFWRTEGAKLLITRETDYALRVLRALAGGGQITTREICERESLPQQFAYKIIKKLSRAGLVSVARGAEGGCRLNVDLKKVSLYDLTKIMDADSLVSACMQPGYRCGAQQKRGVVCTANRQLRQIQNVLNRELRARSLYQMLFDGD